MVIKSNKHNINNTKFNQLFGSGILPIVICTKAECVPTNNLKVSKIIPSNLNRKLPKAIVATKQSLKDNKWELNGIKFPTFNSLWVNIPRMSYTVLRING